MKVEKMEYHGPRAKRCQDKRVTFIFDALDKHLKAGKSPGASWQAALEDYAEFYFYIRSKQNDD